MKKLLSFQQPRELSVEEAFFELCRMRVSRSFQGGRTGEFYLATRGLFVDQRCNVSKEPIVDNDISIELSNIFRNKMGMNGRRRIGNVHRSTSLAGFCKAPYENVGLLLELTDSDIAIKTEKGDVKNLIFVHGFTGVGKKKDLNRFELGDRQFETLHVLGRYLEQRYGLNADGAFGLPWNDVEDEQVLKHLIPDQIVGVFVYFSPGEDGFFRKGLFTDALILQKHFHSYGLLLPIFELTVEGPPVFNPLRYDRFTDPSVCEQIEKSRLSGKGTKRSCASLEMPEGHQNQSRLKRILKFVSCCV